MSGRLSIRGLRNPTRDAVLALLGEGWEAVRWTGNTHLLLRHPCGAAVTAACTNGDRNAGKALLNGAKRAIAQAVARQGGRDGTVRA